MIVSGANASLISIHAEVTMPRVISEEARRERILQELEASEDDRRVQLPWKGDKRNFPVIEVDLDAVVLNPWSHRIRSQRLSHPRRRFLEDEPFSEEAQEIVANMLRDTKEFEDLKHDIEQYDQQEVGVVTQHGVLINGNRRAVALEELGENYIEVAVLPEGASDKELTELEGHLQMRRRFREPYSFTNRLLFIHERLEKYGDTREQLAELLRVEDVEEIDRASRMYGYIDEAQKLLDGSFPLTFFDEKKQPLKDLDKECQKLKRQGKEKEAEFLRKLRLLGMITGFGYEPLRDYADVDFFDNYVTERWESLREGNEEESLKEGLPPLSAFEVEKSDQETDEELGLDILSGDGEEKESGFEIDPGTIAQAVGEAYQEGSVEIADPESEESWRIPGKKFVGSVKQVLSEAFEEAELDQNRADRLEEPAERLRKARNHLKRVVPALKKADQDAQFNWSKFQDRYGTVKRHIQNIETYLSRRSKDIGKE